MTVSLSARADGPDDDDDDGPGAGSGLGVGIGVISAQKPYKGISRDNQALPIVRYENRWVKIFGPEAQIKLPPLKLGESQRLQFGLLLNYDFSGYSPDDAPILSGLSKRKSGLAAGAGAMWRGGGFEVGLKWLDDVSSHSKGQRLELAVEKSWRFEHVILAPYAKATRLDSKYVNYYYGVSADEATADRPAYAGTSTVNLDLGVRTNYLIDQHNSVFVDVGVTRLGSAIKDSPLVDRTTENHVLLGYIYRF